MKTRLSIAFIGNLVDTVSTIILHHKYGFVEGNPAMAWLLQYPWLFASVKMVVMTAVLFWLWCNKESKYAKIASWIAAAVYWAIAIYYGIFFAVLL